MPLPLEGHAGKRHGLHFAGHRVVSGREDGDFLRNPYVACAAFGKDAGGMLADMGNAGLSYNYPDLDTVPEGLVGRVHAKGVKICFRAGDTPEAVARMLALGIDYIPTNGMALATWGSDLKQETYGSATVHLFAFEPEISAG